MMWTGQEYHTHCAHPKDWRDLCESLRESRTTRGHSGSFPRIEKLLLYKASSAVSDENHGALWISLWLSDVVEKVHAMLADTLGA